VNVLERKSVGTSVEGLAGIKHLREKCVKAR
jgi:hypothetical protein